MTETSTTSTTTVISYDDCEHQNVRQIDEHDVECLDCGLVSA